MPGPGPTLAWPGRGHAVLRDPETGRWRWGDRPSTAPSLQITERHGAAPNLLIHADAHDALAAVRPELADKVRFCYIDPPFNTGQEFAAYDDRASHEVWLSGLEERLALARSLLMPGGFLCAHINVVEQAYLKVLLDEMFGRDRLIAQVAWQRAPDRTVLGQGSTLVSDQVEYLLIYVRDAVEPGWPRPQRRMPLPARTLATYRRTLVPSENATLVAELTTKAGAPVRIYRHEGYTLARSRDPRADFDRLMRLTNQQEESTFQQQLLARMPERDVLYRAEYTQATGKHRGPRTRWYLNRNVVLWLRDIAQAGPDLERIADMNNFWPADDIPATGIAREGGVTLRRSKKPERLLERLIDAFSRPGEWVLDFFAGSGTTGAVANRMGRRWLLVEAGPAAADLCLPRLLRAGASFAVATTTR